MKRQLDDYIERLYKPEAKRAAKLIKNDYAEAREIVAWKEEVASKWDQIQILQADIIGNPVGTMRTGMPLDVFVKLDTKGLGDSIGVELVIYKEHDGTSTFNGVRELKVVNEEGSVVTYELHDTVKEAGVYRYSLRMYPKSDKLPHRMDFAYTRWF